MSDDGPCFDVSEAVAAVQALVAEGVAEYDAMLRVLDERIDRHPEVAIPMSAFATLQTALSFDHAIAAAKASVRVRVTIKARQPIPEGEVLEFTVSAGGVTGWGGQGIEVHAEPA